MRRNKIWAVILVLLGLTILNKLELIMLEGKKTADRYSSMVPYMSIAIDDQREPQHLRKRPKQTLFKKSESVEAPELIKNAEVHSATGKTASKSQLSQPILEGKQGGKNAKVKKKRKAGRDKKQRSMVLKEAPLKGTDVFATGMKNNRTNEEFARKIFDIRLIEEQKLRQARMRKFCTYDKFHEHTRPRDYIHMTYSEREHISYCVLPKVGCTNWKKMFLAFNGNKTQDELRKVKKKRWVHQIRFDRIYRLLNEDERTYVRNNFYSFMFSRHPFERLVASFRNKIVEPWNDSYKKRYGSKMLALSRRNMPANEIAKGEGVTFPEFVRYLLVTNPSQFDEHWAIQSRFCQSCLTGYNYYGKMDTLLVDAQMILKENRIDDKYIFFNNQTDKYKVETKDLVKRYYRQVKRDELLKLYEVYKDDFVAFGYEIDEYLKLTKP